MLPAPVAGHSPKAGGSIELQWTATNRFWRQPACRGRGVLRGGRRVPLAFRAVVDEQRTSPHLVGAILQVGGLRGERRRVHRVVATLHTPGFVFDVAHEPGVTRTVLRRRTLDRRRPTDDRLHFGVREQCLRRGGDRARTRATSHPARTSAGAATSCDRRRVCRVPGPTTTRACCRRGGCACRSSPGTPGCLPRRPPPRCRSRPSPPARRGDGFDAPITVDPHAALEGRLRIVRGDRYEPALHDEPHGSPPARLRKPNGAPRHDSRLPTRCRARRFSRTAANPYGWW